MSDDERTEADLCRRHANGLVDAEGDVETGYEPTIQDISESRSGVSPTPRSWVCFDAD